MCSFDARREEQSAYSLLGKLGNQKALARVTGTSRRASGWEGEKVARSWGTHPSHPLDNVYEQAWKDYLWSLPAALLGTRRVLARQGWAGEKVAILSILREHFPAALTHTSHERFSCNR
jgi:hypothetical protein